MTNETHLPRAQLLINLERAGAAMADRLISISNDADTRLASPIAIDALTRAWDRAVGELQAAPAEALAGDAQPVAWPMQGPTFEAFQTWKGYPLPAFNADGQFDGEPLHREWKAFAAGRAAPPLPVAQDAKPGTLTQAQIDHIGEQWDGCMYDAPGMMIDIGESIRAELAKLAAAVPVVAQDAQCICVAFKRDDCPMHAAPSLPAVAPQEQSKPKMSDFARQGDYVLALRKWADFAAPQQPEAEPADLSAQAFDAQRLRNLLKLVGVIDPFPGDDAQILDVLGVLLGEVALKLRLSDRAQLVASEQRAVPVVGELSDEQIVATYESAGIKFQYMFNGKGLTLGSIDVEVMVAAAKAILAAARSAT